MIQLRQMRMSAVIADRRRCWPRARLVAPVSARSFPGLNNNVASAAAQFLDYLLEAEWRVDVDVAEVACSVIETDPGQVTEPVRNHDGPDLRGLLRSRYEPRERQADAHFAAADVEPGERPATDSVADERLDGEGPDGGGVMRLETMGLVIHF